MWIVIITTNQSFQKSFHNTSIHNTYTKMHFKIILLFFFLNYQAITSNGPYFLNIFSSPGSKNLAKYCTLYNLWQNKFRGSRSHIFTGRLLTPHMRAMKLKTS